MARPNWEYIRVDVLLPDHPKIEGLSDKAFRALITLWCYCGSQRTDGIVTARQWEKWPKGVRAELLTAGLAHLLEIGGGCEMHEFAGPDGHQRSRLEIEALSSARSESGRKAAAARWNGHTKTHALRIPKRIPERTRYAYANRMRSAYAIAMPRQWQRQSTVLALRQDRCKHLSVVLDAKSML